MDKYEYNLKLEEIDKLVDQGDYEEAANLADTIEWRRVRNVRTLCLISEIYEAAGKLDKSKDMLVRAYRKSPVGRNVLHRLIEVTTALGQYDEALEYYAEYVQAAPHDNNRYILKYKIYRGRGSSTEELIAILEEYLGQEYTERWAYELATLYQEAGQIQKCMATCDDLVLWFHTGKYVKKALEIKKRYAVLTPKQQQIYEICQQEEAQSEYFDDAEDDATVVRSTEAADGEVLAENIMAETEKEIAGEIIAHKAEKEKSRQSEAPQKSSEPSLLAKVFRKGADLKRPSKNAKKETGIVAELAADEKAEAGNIAARQKKSAGRSEQENAAAVSEDRGLPARGGGSGMQQASGRPGKGGEPLASEPELTLIAYEDEEDSSEYDDLQVELAKSVRKVISGVARKPELNEDDVPAAVEDRLRNIQEICERKEPEPTPGRLSIDDILLSMGEKGKQAAAAARAQREAEAAMQAESAATAEPEEAAIEAGADAAAEAATESERPAMTGSKEPEAVTEAETDVAAEPEKPAAVTEAEQPAKTESEELEAAAETEAEQSAAAEPEKMTAVTAVEQSAATEPEKLETVTAAEQPAAAESEETETAVETKPDYLKSSEDFTGSVPVRTVTAAEAEGLPREQLEALKYSSNPEKLLRNRKSLPTYSTSPETSFGETRKINTKEDLLEAARKELMMSKTIRIPAEEVAKAYSYHTADLSAAAAVTGAETVSYAKTEQQGRESQETAETEQTDIAAESGADGWYEAGTPDAGYQDEAETPEDSYEAEPDMPEDGYEDESDMPEDGYEDEPDMPEDGYEDESEMPEDGYGYESEMPEDGYGYESDMPEDGYEDEPDMPEDGYEDESEMPEDSYEDESETLDMEDAEDLEEEEPEEYYDDPLTIEPHLRGLFQGFTEVEGLEDQIANAILQVMAKGADRTSRNGNILIFGAHGAGKTTLATGLAKAIAQEKGRQTAKMARIYAVDLNRRDIAATIAKIAGGTLIIEEAGDLADNTVEQMTTAMEFRTDGLVVILEDEQRYLHDLLMKHPRFTMKFTAQIYLPVYTADELAMFALQHAREQDYSISEDGFEAIRQMVAEKASSETPMSIGDMIELVDRAIRHSNKFMRKMSMGKKRYDENDYVLLFAKDFK